MSADLLRFWWHKLCLAVDAPNEPPCPLDAVSFNRIRVRTLMNSRRLFFLSVMACLVVLAVSAGTFATTATVPTDQQMVVESRAIVTGRVSAIFSSVDSTTGLVYSYIRLDVSAVL